MTTQSMMTVAHREPSAADFPRKARSWLSSANAPAGGNAL